MFPLQLLVCFPPPFPPHPFKKEIMDKVTQRTFFGYVTVFLVDIRSLGPSQWIRTNIIAYWFARLQQNHPSTDVLLLDPSVAQCMCSFNDASLGPVEELRSSSMVLVPINNHWATDINSGTHWSLLVIVIGPPHQRGGSSNSGGGGTYRPFHIDSANNGNSLLCARVWNVVGRVFQPIGILPEIQHVEGTPHQRNSYDCGSFLCLAAHEIVSNLRRSLELLDGGVNFSFADCGDCGDAFRNCLLRELQCDH